LQVGGGWRRSAAKGFGSRRFVRLNRLEPQHVSRLKGDGRVEGVLTGSDDADRAAVEGKEQGRGAVDIESTEATGLEETEGGQVTRLRAGLDVARKTAGTGSSI